VQKAKQTQIYSSLGRSEAAVTSGPRVVIHLDHPIEVPNGRTTLLELGRSSDADAAAGKENDPALAIAIATAIAIAVRQR
jgi:hypothetical protein